MRYQTAYDIRPKYMSKMRKVFKKYKLEWIGTGWDNGEATGVLIGTKKNLVAFIRSAFGLRQDEAAEHIGEFFG